MFKTYIEKYNGVLFEISWVVGDAEDSVGRSVAWFTNNGVVILTIPKCSLEAAKKIARDKIDKGF